MDGRVEELAAPPEKEQGNVIPHDTLLVSVYKTEKLEKAVLCRG